MRMHTSLFLICVSPLILYFEFRLWVYQLTNNHSLPPPPESWASAVSHAGVAQQHDWNAHDATVFQRMLIHVWGGTSPRFSHIGRPAVSLVALTVPATDAQTLNQGGASTGLGVPNCPILIMSSSVYLGWMAVDWHSSFVLTLRCVAE